MSHELEIKEDGSASMAYAGETPWHKLGKKVSHDLTPAQMLKEAGLDWKVDKVETFCTVDGKQLPVPRAALIRSSDQKILDTVSPGWNPLQNEEAFEFFHDFVMKGDMEMHTAGSLKGGQLIWCLARIKESFTVGSKEDEVQSNLLFTNPHQFGKAIDVRYTPVRVVCANTLALALGARGLTIDQQVVRMSHRKPFDAEKVKQTLGLAHALMEEYKEAAQFVATRRFDDESLNEFFSAIFPRTGKKKDKEISRNHATALKVLESQPGAELSAGSWWQAFNTVTYMTDHMLGRSEETRLDSAWFGSNRKLKSDALNLAVEMAGMAPAL